MLIVSIIWTKYYHYSVGKFQQSARSKHPNSTQRRAPSIVLISRGYKILFQHVEQANNIGRYTSTWQRQLLYFPIYWRLIEYGSIESFAVEMVVPR